MKNLSSTHSVRRVIAVTLLCSTSFLTTGCFGSFATLHKVYTWNRTVHSEKWAQFGIFVATNIVPVYLSAMIFDVMFANSVEFWSGSNPMSAGSERTLPTENGGDVSMRMRDDGAIDVAIRTPARPDAHLVVVSEQGSIAAYDQTGALVARATPATEGAR
ncbi:MAG: DUF3332 family protein [Myxococcota bacterium]